MNAYELADKLQELDAKLHLIVLFKSAEMLRQQANRIAELEKEKEKLKSQIPDWENIRKPNPFVGKIDSNPAPYNIGDIDWTKALK